MQPTLWLIMDRGESCRKNLCSNAEERLMTPVSLQGLISCQIHLLNQTNHPKKQTIMLEKVNLLADCPVQDALKSYEALTDNQ